MNKLKRIEITVGKKTVVVPEMVWTWLELRGALGTPRGEGVLLRYRKRKSANKMVEPGDCAAGWAFAEGDIYDNVGFDDGVEYTDLPEEGEAA